MGETTRGIPERFKGALVLPGDTAYEAARRVWNGRVNRRPALIARCLDGDDVRSGLLFARERGLQLAIRGGGHSCAGFGTCDGGVVLDLSRMRSIRVDPTSRLATAEPGVTWAELDHATQVYGWAVPGGTDSEVGIAGLTLGGGNGWLMGLHGATCDNLVQATVLTADGQLLIASAEENPELFWAIRGGGGNFGIALEFQYRLHPVGPQVIAGAVTYPWNDGKAVLTRFRDWTLTAPDAVTAFACLISEKGQEPAIAIAACYAGPPESAEPCVGGLRHLGSPISDELGPMRYVDWQSQFDAARPFGRHCAMRSHFMNTLTDTLIEILIEEFERAPSRLSAVIVEHCHGAICRVEHAAMAFPHRGSPYHFEILAFWDDEADTNINEGWLRGFYERTSPLGSGEVYVNSLDNDEAGRVAEAYGPNLVRLKQLKARYDPDNVFRINHNIPVDGF